MVSKKEIEQWLEGYKSIVERAEVSEVSQKNGKKVLIAKICFIDASKLETFEATWQGKRKYQYQWMRDDNTLIISWGNDNHHPEIDTHPYHKHIKTRQNVQPSEEMNLANVLAFIAKTLLVLAFMAVTWQIFVS